MSLRRGIVLGLALGALAGCGGGAPPPAPPTGQPAPAHPSAAGPVSRPAPAVLPKEPEPGAPLPAATYNAKGRRDPFIPVSLARDRAGINLSAVKLAGIVQGRQGLLALVEAPEGIGYILRIGDVLGDGRVTAITATSITFAVTTRGAERPQSLTLRLPAD